MPIRTLLPALSLALNIVSIPALAETVPAPIAAEIASPAAERTMAQNRSVVLPMPEAASARPDEVAVAPITPHRLAGTDRQAFPAGQQGPRLLPNG